MTLVLMMNCLFDCLFDCLNGVHVAHSHAYVVDVDAIAMFHVQHCEDK